ncbi:hypothetical protein OUZ56_018386 [Daphnia magna]|uniref:Uncharacterized protein n=1 Tax=Daphnia magna TaxID=35525 RepID=A0ABQ9Z8P5_9CRUS|nr:hypothetical protein OUZ56_018386 [Daphnia magna]
MEDFEKGIFPWDLNSEDDSENESSILSLSQKYELVDTWMLLQRAEEEIKLCKMEMKEYILYLDSARSSLNRNLIDQNVSCEETNQFIAGDVESGIESYTSEEPHDFESTLTEDSDELGEDTEEESEESFEFTDSDQN